MTDDARVGTTVGRFRIDALVGDGATGTVYKAEDLTLQRQVAVKIIHKRLAQDRGTVKRFGREARAASHLKHPNCIEIFDVGETDDGVPFMAMDYVDGLDLATVLEAKIPLEAKRVVRIIKQVAHALAAAHEKGIVHRDIKPENIMLSQRPHPDSVKVLDFGIVKILAKSPVANDSYETLAGRICGTPEYMSPEQTENKPIDGRSDLYSLGVLLYELLTGRAPFEGKGPVAVLRQHLTKNPAPPSELNPNIHPKLEHLTLWLLTKNPEQRPADAKTVITMLDAIDVELTRGPTPRRRLTQPMLALRQHPTRYLLITALVLVVTAVIVIAVLV